MSKLVLGVVGVAEDVSFMGKDGKSVTTYKFQCSGQVDGVQSQFNIKIYGAGSNEKIKSGMTLNGTFNAQYNIYDIKKQDNPDLFPQSQGGGFAGKTGFTPRQLNYELEGIKLAVELVKACGMHTPEEAADKAVAIARATFVPYLRSTTQRHDEVVNVDEQKKIQGQAIRQIIQNNALTELVRGAGLTNGQLMSEYEAAGRDASKLVTALRQKFAVHTPPPAATMSDDDIPF